MIETLDNGLLRLQIDPELGASVTSLDAQIDGTWRPVLASESPTKEPTHAGQSALFFMLPFANRARNNQLIGTARSWDVQPITDEPLSLHGMVWIARWTVHEITSVALVLSCSVQKGAPYPFDAELRVSIEGARATFRLTVTPRGSESVPVGMGFHPYFPRMPNSALTFNAKMRWLEGADHLPTTSAPLAQNEGYAGGRLLPSSWQNNCFTGWDGTLSIDQPDLGYYLKMQASQGLRTIMAYSSPDLDRFAVEPQSHLSGRTTVGPDGLRMIEPNQSWSEDMQLLVRKCH